MKDVGVVDVKYFKCMLFNQELRQCKKGRVVRVGDRVIQCYDNVQIELKQLG